jgi:hypothetical protein
LDACKCGCGVYVWLKEIGGPFNYHHSSFRPLQDRPKEADTDISVFTPLLNAKTLEPVT